MCLLALGPRAQDGGAKGGEGEKERKEEEGVSLTQKSGRRRLVPGSRTVSPTKYWDFKSRLSSWGDRDFSALW